MPVSSGVQALRADKPAAINAAANTAAAPTMSASGSQQASKMARLIDCLRINKDQVMGILNGNSFAIIIALIPSALLSQILPLFEPNAFIQSISFIITLAQSALPILAGLAVGHFLKLGLLESGSIALACFAAAGNAHLADKGFSLVGPGVILNIILVSFLAVIASRLCCRYTGQLKIIVTPLLVSVIAGGIGLITLPYMSAIQDFIGALTAQATLLTPLLMGIVLGVIFSFLVVSPLSSVGIALAISLAGIGSGAANAGIIAGSFTLALMGSSANSLGATLAHFVGSPKIQLANLIKSPKLFIPVFIAAAISGFAAALLQLEGTPFSAGFGFSGLIGPVTALKTSSGELLGLRVLIGMLIVPALSALAMHLIFVVKMKFISPEELKLPDA